MKRESQTLAEYRRLARRNLPALLRFKFLNEYGYDKAQSVDSHQALCPVQDSRPHLRHGGQDPRHRGHG